MKFQIFSISKHSDFSTDEEVLTRSIDRQGDTRRHHPQRAQQPRAGVPFRDRVRLDRQAGRVRNHGRAAKAGQSVREQLEGRPPTISNARGESAACDEKRFTSGTSGHAGGAQEGHSGSERGGLLGSASWRTRRGAGGSGTQFTMWGVAIAERP